MSKKKITVFLSSAGATNAVNVIKALRASDLDVRIVAADINAAAVGLYLADASYAVPRATEKDFVPAVLKICYDEQVDVALPIYSADFPAFDRHRKDFKKAGVRTYAPPAEALEITSDKRAVADFLKAQAVPYPLTWSMEEALEEARFLPYPLFMKLRSGSGSAETRKIHNRKELEFFADTKFVLQELVHGDEYTVDILSTLRGRVMATSPRLRTRVRSGLSVQGTTVSAPVIESYAARIAERLRLPGPSNVQCKLNGGLPVFYDINPRFASGGLPLAVAAGINMPALLVKMLMGWKVPHRMTATPGIVMVRYWDALFVEAEERP